MSASDERIPILYLAPFVDIGGSAKGTIDWFRYIDRDRFQPSLITTQPSPNRLLDEVSVYADEVWDLPDLMSGNAMTRFIIGFIHSRGIRIVHLMNSRIGYDLLPQIARLPSPPRVVVQLHLEDPDRSGYARYVAARYGNLVDAFSVSSRALSDKLGAYDVPDSKRRVIYTGVDAEREFAPARVNGCSDLEAGFFHILFPSRLAPQKDPLLMVEVAAKLRAAGLSFRLHVLGEGPLESVVRDRIHVHGLEAEVILHGLRVAVAPWFAACDLVLLTSAYEGLPYTAYEAMAMERPFLAPLLPGLDELVTPGTGVLVSPQDAPDPYVAAIRELAADPDRRREIGKAARIRALEFPLWRMGAEHGLLYDELLARAGEGGSGSNSRGPRRTSPSWPSPAFRGRSRAAQLVTVIVPCFNDGHYLRSCLHSIARQTYAPIETIVVDDGSTDPGTLEALDETSVSGSAKVLRMAVNSGPGAARNAAIVQARGRYILPIDADDVLLPGAVGELVRQLCGAGERIGFIYPNLQFFGNRTDYFEAPSYNLDTLLRFNYCDTASLLDGDIFERGLRYAEDIAGREDWDFFLSLAEHGIHGEPANSKTLLHRKHGFTRSDRVMPGIVEQIANRHPDLFDPRTRAWRKGEWNPAVSVIALDPPASQAALQGLIELAVRQTCADFELVIGTAGEVEPSGLGRRLRRFPRALAGSRARSLALGLQAARGRYALAFYGSAASLLADRTLIEKGLRALDANPNVDSLALTDGGGALPALHLLTSEQIDEPRLGAVWWSATGPEAPAPESKLAAQQPLETLARWLSLRGRLQWRHLRPSRGSTAPTGFDDREVQLGSPRTARPGDARIRAQTPPQLPDLASGVESRIGRSDVWMPPQAHPLCRHLHRASQRYVFTNDWTPPAGAVYDRVLGCVRDIPLPGTRCLTVTAGGDGDDTPGLAFGEVADFGAPELLGYVEQAHLALMDPMFVGRSQTTGQQLLIAGSDDPLAGMVDGLECIGFVEAYPINPQLPPHEDVAYCLVGLVRTLDLEARRHRYGAGQMPPGRFAGELGALLTEPIGDCEPLWIDADGRPSAMHPDLAGHERDVVAGRPSASTLVRWTGAPLTWRRSGPLAPRLRAVGRRAYDSARALASTPPARPRASDSDPAGYVLRSAASWTIPLYRATHPITGDQLLSTLASEPEDLGYEDVSLIGHLVARPLVTDTLGIVRAGVPWATNFGRVTGR